MNNLAKYVIGAVVTLVVVFLVWYFSSIVTYILIAAVLAIITKPLVRFVLAFKIKGRNIPKWAASLLALITVWFCVVLFIVLFVPLIAEKLSQFSVLEISQVLQSFSEPISKFQTYLQETFALRSVDFSLTDAISSQLSSLLNLSSINNIFSSFISIIGSTAVAIFSVSFITFFFMKEDELFFNMVYSLFPPKYEENLRRALDSVTELLIRYFTGLVAESCIVMLVLSLTLMLFGMEANNAFFIGFLVGLFNVIPYIGPMIGAFISIFFGVVDPIEGMPLLTMILVIIGSVLFVQAIDNFVLQPFLYSNRVKAHPLEIFIVILIAGSVAGVLGMLLAIPSYNVLRVFAKEFFNNFRLVQKLTEKI